MTTIFGDEVLRVAPMEGYPLYVLAVVVNPFTLNPCELPIRKDQLADISKAVPSQVASPLYQ